MRLIPIASEKTFCIGLSFKLVPVQEYENFPLKDQTSKEQELTNIDNLSVLQLP